MASAFPISFQSYLDRNVAKKKQLDICRQMHVPLVGATEATFQQLRNTTSNNSKNACSENNDEKTESIIHGPAQNNNSGKRSMPISSGAAIAQDKLQRLSARFITNVWRDNLRQELERIQEIIENYPFIAMDTEFPGVIARPVGSFKNSQDYHYQTLKCNVDMLKIIQFGICLCDANGNSIPGASAWQFNFQFNLQEDIYAQDSIDLLSESGIDFEEHRTRGIDPAEFAELIIQSGIVLNDDIRWLSFHAGYDYGYLLKLLTCQAMPAIESDFFELLNIFFPTLYDIKYVMKSIENFHGGLEKLAASLSLERIGPQHQAGSDALLTAAIFFKLRSLYFEGRIDDEKFNGVLFGLGQELKRSEVKRKKVVSMTKLFLTQIPEVSWCDTKNTEAFSSAIVIQEIWIWNTSRN